MKALLGKNKGGRPPKEKSTKPTGRQLVKRACDAAGLNASPAAVNLAAQILDGKVVLPPKPVVVEAWQILDGGTDAGQPLFPLVAILRQEIEVDGAPIVTIDGLRAGVAYAELAARIHGPARGVSAFVRAYVGFSPGQFTIAAGNRDDKLERRFAAMSAALDTLGTPGRRYFDSVVREYTFPDWARERRKGQPRDDIEKRWIAKGLRAVADSLSASEPDEESDRDPATVDETDANGVDRKVSDGAAARRGDGSTPENEAREASKLI